MLNLRPEPKVTSLALGLSFKIVARYFSSASQLSCVLNSSSESQGSIACYFLSSPLVASQSYEARPTLSASADKHSLTHACSLPEKMHCPLNSEVWCHCLWLAAYFPPVAPSPHGFQESEHMRNRQIRIIQIFQVNRLQHNLIIFAQLLHVTKHSAVYIIP